METEKKKTEFDLEIYDVWRSPNGNLFLKIDNEHSIPLGTPNSVWLDDEAIRVTKANSIVPVEKVGRVQWNDKETKSVRRIAKVQLDVMFRGWDGSDITEYVPGIREEDVISVQVLDGQNHGGVYLFYWSKEEHEAGEA